MAENAKEFQYESFQDLDSIVRHLNALGSGFHKGSLQLSSNGDKFVLIPPRLVKFDIRAKQKDDRAQIVLKISWKDRKQGKALKVEPLRIADEGKPT